MNGFFVFLFLLFAGALVLGLIKPSWLRMPSRKRSSAVFGTVTAVFFVLVAVTAPPVPAQPAPSVSAATTTTTTSTNTPIASAPAAATTAVDPTKQVVATLSNATDGYASLFASGKQILGTTQYSGGLDGLQAFNDPNSAAVRFGAFRTDTCLKNDPSQASYAAYKTASDLYYSANITQPDALDTWNNDINDAASDICTWAGDAVSWQLQEVSTAKLQADAKKVNNDLAAARADIQTLSK